MEHASIDPAAKVMKTTSKNVTHTKIMFVEETQSFSVHPENPNWTQITTEARVKSNMGFGLEGRLEHLGVSRFQKNYDKVRPVLFFLFFLCLCLEPAGASLHD